MPLITACWHAVSSPHKRPVSSPLSPRCRSPPGLIETARDGRLSIGSCVTGESDSEGTLTLSSASSSASESSPVNERAGKRELGV